jgi:putative transposase
MSRKGNCRDNARWRASSTRSKSSAFITQHYATRNEAQRDIFAYIEGFYNRTRRRSAIGYVSPVEMEQKAD